MILGMGIGLPFGSRVLSAIKKAWLTWRASVIADGGTVEIPENDWTAQYELVDDFTWSYISGAGKASVAYATVPSAVTDRTKDLAVTRAGASATRVNEQGLLETVAANVPRHDFDFSGAFLGVLIEGQRVNFVNNSVLLNTFGGASLASTSETNPFGVATNVQRLTYSSTGGVRNNNNYSLTSGLNYALGHLIKFDGVAITLNLAWSSAGTTGTGTFSFDANGNPSSTGDVGFFKSGNGFYYVFLQVVATSAAIGRLNVTSDSGSILIYNLGTQYEQGIGATSFIPTSANAVTRDADVITRTGASAYIGQTEGTIVCYFTLQTLLNQGIVSISNNSTFTGEVSLNIVSGAIRLSVGYGSGTVINVNGAQLDTLYKIAMRYKENDFAIAINGELYTNTSFTFPASVELNTLRFGSSSAGSVRGFHCQLFAVKNTTKTNAELIELTTL